MRMGDTVVHLFQNHIILVEQCQGSFFCLGAEGFSPKEGRAYYARVVLSLTEIRTFGVEPVRLPWRDLWERTMEGIQG